MIRLGLGFDPQYFDRDVVFRWRAGWAGLAFSRPSPAWYVDGDGILREAAPDVPRIEWYDLDGDGVRETPTMLLEPGATNVLLDSCNLPASGSAWGSTSNFTVSPAASIFQGQTAWRHQNLGLVDSARRSQFSGMFTDRPETASAIVENVNATETALNIRDYTAEVNLCIGLLTWATGQARVQQGAGTVIARKLANAGPNGGPVYRLIVTATGTAGNAHSVLIYPSGTSQNTQTAIVHHVQYEVGPIATSPIVTTTAAVTRSADALTFPWPHAPQAMTGYLRFVERGAVAMTSVFRALLQIGTDTTAPRLFVGAFSTNTTYRLAFLTPTSSVASILPTAPPIGARVELLWRLYADGSVQIEQSIDGGTPVVAARSSGIGLPAAWSGQILRLSGVPNVRNEAPAAWRDAVVLRGAAWTMDDVRRLVR